MVCLRKSWGGGLAQIRQLTEGYKAGKVPDFFDAFRDLVYLLFCHTILAGCGKTLVFADSLA
jgi:hypothetical protein